MKRHNSVEELSDNELMRQVRDGQVEQLGLLFERHHAKLFNFFLRLTNNHALSEDLVQEVFLRMLKYRLSYSGDSAFGPWMYQIARNAHYDALRKKRPEQPLENEEGESPEEAVCLDPLPDAQAHRQQELEFLKTALAQLPPDKREVLVLSRIQELKCEEIAQIVHCEPGTVRVRIHRALQDLKALMSRLMKEQVI